MLGSAVGGGRVLVGGGQRRRGQSRHGPGPVGLSLTLVLLRARAGAQIHTVVTPVVAQRAGLLPALLGLWTYAHK